MASARGPTPMPKNGTAVVPTFDWLQASQQLKQTDDIKNVSMDINVLFLNIVDSKKLTLKSNETESHYLMMAIFPVLFPTDDSTT